MAITSKSSGSTHKSQVKSKTKGQNVRFLKSSRSSPLWLLCLCNLQQTLSIVTWLLVSATLTIYGWSVYSEQRWNQANSRRETLQLRERQLMSINEMLKDKLALQAQQVDMGLVPPNPEEAIVLQPASNRPTRATKSILNATKPSDQTNQLTSIPLGY